jgi:hypothetical protein
VVFVKPTAMIRGDGTRPSWLASGEIAAGKVKGAAHTDDADAADPVHLAEALMPDGGPSRDQRPGIWWQAGCIYHRGRRRARGA